MKILVPIDGSPLSIDALQHALVLIRSGLQAELVLANVQEPATLYEMVVVHDPQALNEVSEGAGAHILQPAVQMAMAAGVECTQEVAVGDPARTLIEIAERHGCDAVVMGGHGAGSVRSALLGSVSQDMVRYSPVPVTLVKTPEAVDDTASDGEA